MIQKKTNFRFKLDNVILKTNKKLQQKQMSLLVSLSTFRKVKKKTLDPSYYNDQFVFKSLPPSRLIVNVS